VRGWLRRRFHHCDRQRIHQLHKLESAQINGQKAIQLIERTWKDQASGSLPSRSEDLR